MPSSFDPLITAWDTMEEEKLSIHFVKRKLFNFQLKKNNNKTVRSESSAFHIKSQKFNIKNVEQNNCNKGNSFRYNCYSCGK